MYNTMYKILIFIQLLCVIYSSNSNVLLDDAKCVCTDKDTKFITTVSGKILLDANAKIITLKEEERIIDRLDTIVDRIQVSNAVDQTNCKRYYPTSCAEATANHRLTGIYNIQLDTIGPKPFQVSCVEDMYGGGWTVVLRRRNGAIDFYRTWAEYKRGFGNIDDEFFIGLDKLHALTNGAYIQELIFELEDFNGVWKYVKYSSFAIGDESERYVLKLLGTHSGEAADAFTYHAGHTFKTKDVEDKAHNCSQLYKGAWWYNQCYDSNLCGVYLYDDENGDGGGVVWKNYDGDFYSLKSAVMMIRPQRILH